MSWEIKILGSRRIMRQDLRRQLGTLSISQAKVVAGPEWERQEWLETWSEMLMWGIWWPQKSVLCSRMVIVNWTFTCIPLDDELGECYSRRRAEPGTTHHHYGPEKRWWYNGQVQQAWPWSLPCQVKQPWFWIGQLCSHQQPVLYLGAGYSSPGQSIHKLYTTKWPQMENTMKM